MTELRQEVLELIAVAIVELRDLAQPRDISQLRELELDAIDADSDDQLRGIAAQVENLRGFCMSRKKSSETVPPPVYRRL